MDCNTADVPSNVVHDSPDLKTDESSDNEPLIKIAKKSSRAAKEKSVDSKKKESLDDDDSSDDEPLSELRNKLYPQRQRKSPGTPSRKTTPVMKSKRNAARKKVKYTESSSDNSDDESLATVKRKLTKTSANSKKTQPNLKDKSLKGNSSSCSDDDVPLSKLRTRPHGEEKQSRENTHSSNANSKKDKSASCDSSDDEPLIKKKFSAPAKKSEEKENTSVKSNGTNDKKADLKTDESSDNEPLIKIAKTSSRAAKKKSVDSKKKESLDDDDSSDDEPLSELRKKLYPQRQRKSPGTPSRKTTPVMKSKRNAARKKVKYTEPSSDSSDDEPLATMKRKLTKTSANSKKTQPNLKDRSLKDPSSSDSSSDDDVPLVTLIAKKKKPVNKNTKTTTASHGRASRKRREPSSSSSDDEPSIKAAKHPQVTKILRIILKRCDGEEAGDSGTGGLNKSSAEMTIDEKTLEESESSEESPEEE